jgi:hypothetical protein
MERYTMLDTAFDKRIAFSVGWSESAIKARNESQMKVWSYVGRFVWGFAMIEKAANEIFFELIGGGRNPPNQASSAAIGLFLTYSLDLRKKLKMIEIILERRDIDVSETFKRLHQLHDLRNVIVHHPFEEEDKNRLSCDYGNQYGDSEFSKKPATSGYDHSITYAEFDLYDAAASEVYAKLDELLSSDAVIPTTEDELQHAIKVEEAIA